MVKRLRHRPFTAVTGVQIPLESSCERENEIFERHAIGKIHTPMWLNFREIKIACTMETSDARMLALT